MDLDHSDPKEAALWQITMRFGPNLREEAERIFEATKQFLLDHDAYDPGAGLFSAPWPPDEEAT